MSAPPVNLAGMPVSQRLAHAGIAVAAIVRAAQERVSPRRIYLFGSRATGEARPLSDIDIGLDVDEPKRWSELAAWVREEAPTLLDVDLVDLARCDGALRRSIVSQGVLIYER